MLKLAIIFGGMSTEHDISVISGISVLKNLDKSKYEIYQIYIGKDGRWYEYNKNIENISTTKIGEDLTNLKLINNVIEYLRKMDCIFPVLHGKYGEDGTIQGMFEMIKIPYVGCGTLSSSIAMDKAYTKILFDRAKLKQAKYIYTKKLKGKYIVIENNFDEQKLELDELINKVVDNIEFPIFVKPSNSGSSIGVSKSNSKEELKNNIEYSSKFDNKILIEQGIIGREIECAVLENENIISSCVGEVISAENFYTFDSKYKNKESKVQIPAELDKEIIKKIKDMSVKAFKAIDGNGLSRVDFFVENNTNNIYINEINTMPGFTSISMYPKLFEHDKISYRELLNKLINISMEKCQLV